MTKSPFANRPGVEALVHRSVVDMLVHEARAVDEFTHPAAFAAAIAARSSANRAALARLGEALVRAAATAHVPGTLV